MALKNKIFPIKYGIIFQTGATFAPWLICIIQADLLEGK